MLADVILLDPAYIKHNLGKCTFRDMAVVNSIKRNNKRCQNRKFGE